MVGDEVAVPSPAADGDAREPAALHAAVIGGGVAGLCTALALSRAGHRVTIIERDATPTPADADAAFAWDRRGAPQVRHSHALLARLHNTLRDRYPDVLEALLDAGATEIRFCDLLPEDMVDREPRPGDEDLVALACRRTTFEMVLRRIVLADELVDLRHGVAVAGLVAGLVADAEPETDRTGDRTGDPARRPRVTGVRLTADPDAADGATEVLHADLVVAATGRRSPVPRWLAELGVELDVREEDTGIIYLSRFYRLRDGAELPDQQGPIGGDLGYLKYAVFLGDNRTYSVTFAVGTHDDELRAQLLDPEGFDAAARLLPATTAWAQPDVGEPITPVHVMAGLLNRRVRWADDAGPLVLGFHVVGDAHTCTNPLYGRGCSLAVVQADLLADAVQAEPDDARARGARYEAGCAREVEPWYRAAVAQDRDARRRAATARAERAAAAGEPTAPAGDDTTAVDGAAGDRDVADPPELMADLVREGLLPAARLDPVVFRAFVRGFNLLEPPEALMTDADVIGRVLAVYQDRDQRPPEPSLGPPRAEMLERLAVAR